MSDPVAMSFLRSESWISCPEAISIWLTKFGKGVTIFDYSAYDGSIDGSSLISGEAADCKLAKPPEMVEFFIPISEFLSKWLKLSTRVFKNIVPSRFFAFLVLFGCLLFANND